MAANKNKKKRRITICRKSVMDSYRIYKHYPSLHLSGKWLQENGFMIGQVVDILCEDNMLLITVAEEQRFNLK